MSNSCDDLFRKKFETYNELCHSMTPDEAWEKMLEGYPERQRKWFAPFIDNNSLVEGFRQAIPAYAEMGMVMDVADTSNNDIDGVIEIQRKCPYYDMAKSYGVEDPCHLLCDMDIEATRRAYPEMKAKYIARQSEGDSVCAYMYQRPAKK